MIKEKYVNFTRQGRFFGIVFVCAILGLNLLISEENCTDKLLSKKDLRSDTELSAINQEGNQCFLKEYSNRDVQQCLGRLSGGKELESSTTRVYFIGNDVAKDLYIKFKLKIEGVKSTLNEGKLLNGSVLDSDLNVKFIHIISIADPSFFSLLDNWEKNKFLVPDVVVFGFNPLVEESQFRNPERKTRSLWMKSVASFAFKLDLVSEKTTALWVKTSPDEGAATHNISLQLYSAMQGTHVQLWNFLEPKNPSKSNRIYASQVLLNVLCNKFLTESSSYCCAGKGYISGKWIGFCVAAVVCISAGMLLSFWWMSGRHWNILGDSHLVSRCPSPSSGVSTSSKNGDVEANPENEKELLQLKPGYSTAKTSISVFVRCFLILFYFFVCDRTSVLRKEAKSFQYESFVVPLLVIYFVTFASKVKSNSPHVLSRDQTDEWKGWMQVVILVYHWTGASSKLGIYMHVRILVSSYLFMTGFGNFTYYWKGGDLSFVRYAQVMMRLNLLTIALCLVMKRSYQFYYFVPLVSFWYTFLFFVLWLPPNLHLSKEGTPHPSLKDYAIIFIKLIISGAAIYALSSSKSSFDTIFLAPAWRPLFLVYEDDYEWWFRWRLDRFSILYGAAFGLIYKGFEQKFSNIAEGKCWITPRLNAWVMAVFGTISLLSYLALPSLCFTKQQCNEVHPYIVWIPIMGYITLRNLTEGSRSLHSVVMANAGKISLELFVCQYHIWLAADTQGILILTPWFSPLVNVTIASIIFVWVAYETHAVTGQIVNFVVSKDQKKTSINLFLLLSVCVALKLIL